MITDQRREDMIVGALEGGSNYWYFLEDDTINKVHNCTNSGRPLSIRIWEYIKNGNTVAIHDAEDYVPSSDILMEKLGDINLESIKKGEALMKEKSPEHYNNIITENDDAETADVWFQYCVLGDIVYG